MADEPPICLCMINRNGEHHLPATLEAIRNQHWQFAEQIIVDDASDDASRALIRELAPRAHLITLEKRGGPAKARNTAFAACHHDLALFIDNDVRLKNDTVKILLDDLVRHKQALLVTPRTLYEKNPQTIQYDSADCHFLGLMTMRLAEQHIETAGCSPARTTSVNTSCFLIRRNLWGDTPLFDERFGFNLEDHDFGIRSQLLGHELRIQPHAQIHHGGGSQGLSYRQGDVPSDDRLYYLVRNRWFIIAKYFKFRTIFLLAPALLFYELAQFAMLVARGKPMLYIKALRSLISERASLRAQRRDIQMLRQRQDRDYLKSEALPFTQWIKSGHITGALVKLLETMLIGYWRLVRRLV